MNPFDLDPTGLLIWGFVAHRIADFLLQNDWMAKHKAERNRRRVLDPRPGPDLYDKTATISVEGRWYDRHLAAYVHAALHGLLLVPVFGWPAAVVAVVHLVIDCRWPVAWWGKLVGQTPPEGAKAYIHTSLLSGGDPYRMVPEVRPLFDIGMWVRLEADQTFHLVVLAIAALVCG